MGYRLSRIYTGKGDDGTTGLAGGDRIVKDAPRIVAMGSVDELNAAIGMILSETIDDDIRHQLTAIQHHLFDLGGELAMPGHALLASAIVTEIEASLDELNDALPPLEEFILPGGSRAASLAHVARTIARRAERDLVTLARDEALSALARQYINRLSDYLFVVSRVLNQRAGVADVSWSNRFKKGKEAD
ncbi:cob(I)yrinic acid a,c-diamide adenosyltransferase [Gammaproteobacteria bacterium]|nr:cob(I)yrinic acid a,c-diamide adenosyltransferase [Gammaproteobacteria bacterium]